MLLAEHWTANVKSEAFTLFGRDIAWYGIIITCAMLLGLVLAIVRGKKISITADDFLEVFLIAIPFAIIFGRLGYVIPRWSDYFYTQNFDWSSVVDIIAVWDGGITIMTAVPGGILGGYVWCRWRKVDFIKSLDRIICVVLLSQALGRWGNFCNQELYGAAIIDPAQQWFPLAVYIKGSGWHQALFFYEMMLNLVGFLIILFFTDRINMRGFGISAYVAAYGTIRFVMEFFRDDGDIYDVFNYNQLICALIALAALVFITVRLVMLKKEGRHIWYPKGLTADVLGSARLKQEKSGNKDGVPDEEQPHTVPENKSKKKKKGKK